MRRTMLGLVVCVLSGALVIAAPDDDRMPELMKMAMLANLYPPVDFDHSVHAEIAGDCASCHHQPFGDPAPCASCHDGDVAPSAFVHEMHWEVEDCTGCHRRPETTDLRCVTCHPIEPDPARLDVIGLKGAYHGLCLGCHGETGSDTSCGVCHPGRQALN